MQAQLSRPSIHVLGLFVSVVVLAGFAYSVSAFGQGSDAIEASGQVEIDGTVYRFAPTTCTITDTDFLAAGEGEIDGEEFWVSASPDRINLAVGSSTGVQRVGTDDLWLMSVDKVSWEIVGRTIIASVEMRDERDTNAPSLDGNLSVDCSTA